MKDSDTYTANKVCILLESIINYDVKNISDNDLRILDSYELVNIMPSWEYKQHFEQARSDKDQLQEFSSKQNNLQDKLVQKKTEKYALSDRHQGILHNIFSRNTTLKNESAQLSLLEKEIINLETEQKKISEIISTLSYSSSMYTYLNEFAQIRDSYVHITYKGKDVHHVLKHIIGTNGSQPYEEVRKKFDEIKAKIEEHKEQRESSDSTNLLNDMVMSGLTSSF